MLHCPGVSQRFLIDANDQNLISFLNGDPASTLLGADNSTRFSLDQPCTLFHRGTSLLGQGSPVHQNLSLCPQFLHPYTATQQIITIVGAKIYQTSSILIIYLLYVYMFEWN